MIAGQYDDTVDAGMLQLASIGDFVWRDNNDNGIQDSVEPGIDGVTVHLLDSTGTVIDTTTTTSGGKYLFDNRVPDTYGIQFVLPSDSVRVQR